MNIQNIKSYVSAWWVEHRAAIIVSVLLGFACGAVFASTATVSWVNSTQNTDGSPIPATGPGSIQSTRIEWGNCVGTAFGTAAGNVVVPASQTSTVISSLGPAVWCFRGFHVNTYGIDSAPSNVVNKTIVAPTPRPPVLATIVASVYDVKFDWREGDYELGRVVGTAPLGTPCTDKFSVGDSYQVPRKAVKLDRRPRSAVLVARCAMG